MGSGGRIAAKDQAARDRKTLMKAGHKPRIPELQKRRFWEEVSRPDPHQPLGHQSIARAAELAGISPAQAYRMWANADERDANFRMARLRVAPAPLPFKDLDEHALRLLHDSKYMATRIFGHYEPPWAAMVDRRLTESYFRDEQSFWVLNAPPGGGKTTTVTLRWVVKMALLLRSMGYEPRIFLGHKTEKKSKAYLRRIAALAERNADLLGLFGRIRPEKTGVTAPWSTEELLWEPLRWDKQIEKEATFTRGSLEGSVLSGRYDIMVCDDWLDLGEQEKPERRDEVYQLWDQEIESRAEKHGLVLLSNARIVPEDLSWQLRQVVDPEDIDDITGKPRPVYSTIALPAHYDSLCDGKNHTGPTTFDAQTNEAVSGCLLDPQRNPWKKLRIRQIKNPDSYALVYQQQDTSPKGGLCQREWFRGGKDAGGFVRKGCLELDYLFGQRPKDWPDPTLSVMSIDPSASNWWGCWHLLYYADTNTFWAYKMGREHLRVDDLLYPDYSGEFGYRGLLEDWWIAGTAAGLAPTYVLFEARAVQKWWTDLPYTEEWAASHGISVQPHDTNRANKNNEDFGVDMIRDYVREGRLRLPYGGQEERIVADAFMQEAVSWPKGSTTDMVMSLWFVLNRLEWLVDTEMAMGSMDTPIPAPSWVQQEYAQIPGWVREVAASGVT